jgi:hypothetical protein
MLDNSLVIKIIITSKTCQRLGTPIIGIITLKSQSVDCA